ncbi:helix-turn-helix transcriptional regulator [Pseudomonas sp. S3E12]|uniref:helix-turn-helix transcriptional regulator n=1 Tax=Pseudomonas sp. S3E12 TaxID=1873126 RepID=UPI00081C1BFE|nr:helix-turn-helix transcriptional regulator [Pseudomonas sp. S3E12]OCW23992.1 hypothetical protein BB029_12750 [Pseudomonas sp. S3E12]
MGRYFFANPRMNHIDDAAAHFGQHDDRIALIPLGKAFNISKRFCMLGSSFVSLTLSESGWGYEMSSSVDGFLLIASQKGQIEWKATSGTQRLRPGEAALVDHKQVSSATHSQEISYTTVYISGFDMYSYMTMILGKPLGERVAFTDSSIEARHTSLISAYIQLIFNLAEHTTLDLSKVLSSLKESLIGYIIHNIPNNYSAALFNDTPESVPTPYSIIKAIQFMRDSNDPHLTVGEVAIHAGMSVRSLQSGFKRYKETTPILFLREIRLQKAFDLLAAGTNCPVKEIAFGCGFTNYQIFCRYYLKKFGIHPSYYNKK